jgi:AraC-like DNA-binding protein
LRTDFKTIEENQKKNELFLIKNAKRRLLMLAIFSCCIFISAQSGPDFSILADKAFQKLYQNPDDCISYSQSLLISDQNTEHKIILQNIISQAYAMKGDYVQSVTVSAQKESLEKDQDLSYFMQLFGEYNLADQYQNLDLYNQSQKIISSLLSDNKLLKNESPKSKITIAKLYQLQAINSAIIRNYSAAFNNLNKSDQYIDVHNEENKMIGFENKIFRASYLMRQNKYDEAKMVLDQVIINLKKESQQPFLSALAYENLSRYYFLTEDYKTAIDHLEKALLEVENLPYNNLRSKIYESLAKTYFAQHNDTKYHEYNKLYIELKSKLDSNQKEGIRYIVKLVETNQNNILEFQKQNESKKLWLLILVFLSSIIALVIYFLIEKRRNKELKKQVYFFEKQKKRELSISVVSNLKEVSDRMMFDKIAEKDSNKISKEKEIEILQKLNDWEQSDRYLNKNMSLSTLSAQMGVNTKYLSEVINNSKGKNFNGYINELRINHIAHLLKTDPVFLHYKVSYLAEFSGFSSHSAFTTVFKSVTGMSPNSYIQEITKNKTS